MKKIITAISNPKLNEELRKENNFKIIGKDLQYKEAILELLEKDNKIDLIIMNENLLGDISFEKLFEKIKLINEKIKIIFILEKENNELKNILIKNNINNIYYKNKINLIELIKLINKKENNKLKNTILEKNNKKIENKFNKKEEKNKLIKNNIKNKNKKEIKIKENKNSQRKQMIKDRKLTKKIEQKVEENEAKNNIMSSKIITFSGNSKSGKTTLALIISQYLSNKNYRVLLVDADFEKYDLNTILKKDFEKQERKANFFKKNLLKNNLKLKKYKINYNNTNNKNEKKEIKIINKENKNKLKIKNDKNKKLKTKNNKNKKIKIYKIKYLKIKKFNSKNKIYIREINNIINSATKKINNNFYFFSKINSIIRKKNNNNEKIKINILIQILKNKYDLIIFDLSKYNYGQFNKEILKKSNLNFLITDSNLLGVKEIQRLTERYYNKWKIDKNSLHIIENKYNFGCINKDLISKIIPNKKEIFLIKENKKYIFLIDNFFKRNILLKNKKIQKDLNKIIKKIF